MQLLHFAFSLLPFLHSMYWGHPWYTGQIWGNIFVVIVAGPLGWAWSRTKFWPFRPLRVALTRVHSRIDELHDKHDAHADLIRDLHRKVDELHELVDTPRPE